MGLPLVENIMNLRFEWHVLNMGNSLNNRNLLAVYIPVCKD